jgi:hypothetical protein
VDDRDRLLDGVELSARGVHLVLVVKAESASAVTVAY